MKKIERRKMNPKIKFKNNKLHFLCLVFLGMLLVIFISCRQSAGQNQSPQRPTVQNEQVQNQASEDAANNEQLSIWNIILMTDWLFWPFVMLTIAGLLLISYRTLLEYREKTRAQEFYVRSAHESDINSLVETIQNSKPNRTSQLIHLMIRTFNKTGRAEPIANDVDQFLNAERNSFATFNRIMDFLSDTAGALGLLGTVWGIFVTFHGGKLDGPTILSGMSVSLITTLVGLIISLVLNMGTTAVFALFNGELNVLFTKAKETRQTLLSLEKESQFDGKPGTASVRPKVRKDEVVTVVESEY